jgi:hypothetical protein
MTLITGGIALIFLFSLKKKQKKSLGGGGEVGKMNK